MSLDDVSWPGAKMELAERSDYPVEPAQFWAILLQTTYNFTAIGIGTGEDVKGE